MDMLLSAVNELITVKEGRTEKIQEDAHAEYSCETMANGYMKVYRELLEMSEETNE